MENQELFEKWQDMNAFVLNMKYPHTSSLAVLTEKIQEQLLNFESYTDNVLESKMLSLQVKKALDMFKAVDFRNKEHVKLLYIDFLKIRKAMLLLMIECLENEYNTI